MVAGAAEVLQALVAVRAQHEVGLHRIAAVRALAVLHELALLERDLQLLLVAVDLQQRRAQQAVGDDAQQRDERHDGPHVPVGAAQVRVADHPDDGEHVQNDEQYDDHGERGLQLGRPQLGQQFSSFQPRFPRSARSRRSRRPAKGPETAAVQRRKPSVACTRSVIIAKLSAACTPVFRQFPQPTGTDERELRRCKVERNTVAS